MAVDIFLEGASLFELTFCSSISTQVAANSQKYRSGRFECFFNKKFTRWRNISSTVTSMYKYPGRAVVIDRQ